MALQQRSNDVTALYSLVDSNANGWRVAPAPAVIAPLPLLLLLRHVQDSLLRKSAKGETGEGSLCDKWGIKGM